jgi:hypothetical protein
MSFRVKIKNSKPKSLPQDVHPLHPEKKLLSRRDFLSVNAKAFAVGAVLPSVFDLVFMDRLARAQGCDPTGGGASNNFLPVIMFDLAGGAGLAHNFVMMDQGGSLLPSYAKLGLEAPSSFIVDQRFGAPMAQPILDAQGTPSSFRSEIRDALVNPALLPPDLASKLRMGVICNQSLSDSAQNALLITSLVTKAGLRGSLLQSALGNRPTDSGGNSMAANVESSAMVLQDAQGLTAAVSYGSAFSTAPVSFRDKIAKAAANLSQTQSQRLLGLDLGAQLAALGGCAFEKNKAYTQNVSGIDARLVPEVASIFGITPQTSSTDQNAVNATIAMNTIKRNCGAGVITLGGYDYHDGTATTGAARNLAFGQLLARVLRVASLYNTPLVFTISTDGGIYSDVGTRVYRGDSNGKSCTIFGVFAPSGPVPFVRTQIGHYNEGEDADRNTFVGADPRRVAHVLFYNYLLACGQAQYYPVAATRDPIPSDELPRLSFVNNYRVT